MVILAVFPSLQAAELVLSINLSIIFTFYNAIVFLCVVLELF